MQASGTLLAAGTAIRLLSRPIAGRLADYFDAPRLIFAICAAAAALTAFIGASRWVPLSVVLTLPTMCKFAKHGWQMVC